MINNLQNTIKTQYGRELARAQPITADPVVYLIPKQSGHYLTTAIDEECMMSTY